ncbi:MAG: M6 family metalloprotease domain-containing protein [Thermoanaerobaculum sp.]|nr:M6 family metalloprotease domain-containing protein [Thermoanaerobaculum sp.]MDW7967974.1 M6 family metalloprotease domain-containing protein [Thermoanaerobaculum sp.]
MKHGLLAALAAGLLAVVAEAVSVNPQRQVVVQPDGSVVEVTPVGDEFNLWWELPTGETVILDQEGFLRLAVLDEAGRLVPGPPVGRREGLQALAGWPKHLRPTASGWGAGELLPVLPFSRPEGIATLSAATSQPILVLLVSFTDRQPVGSQPADFSALLFQGDTSAAAYLRQATLHKLALEPAAEGHGVVNDGVVGWLALPMAHPNRGLTGSKDPAVTEQQKRQAAHNMRLAVAAAIQAADPFVDFSRYDRDRNGGISRRELALVVITAGYESSFGGYKPAYSPANWGHRWSLGNFNDGVGAVPGPVVDGVVVGDSSFDGGYTSFGEWMQSSATNGHRSTVGILVHELGHDTLGLPDLYDTDGSSAGVGGLCLMGSGSWGCEPPCYGGELPVLLSAWARVVTEVVRPRDLRGTEAPRLSPAPAAGEVLRLGTGAGPEYFLLEQRRAQGFDRGLLRWDAAFASAPGLAVWHVDESKTSNADENQRMVDLEEASGTEPLNGKDNLFAAEMLFRPGGNTRFSDSTTPKATRQGDWGVTGVSVEVSGWEGERLVLATLAPNPVGVDHDTCAGALLVTLNWGETYRFRGWLAQATGGDVLMPCAPVSKTAFWQLVPRRTGKLSVLAQGYDTVAALFRGSCATLTPFDCNDDVDSAGSSQLSERPVRRGEPLYLVVGRYGSGRPVGGELDLTVSLAPANPLLVQVLTAQGCPRTAVKFRVGKNDGAAVTDLQPSDVHVFLENQELPVQSLIHEGSGVYWVWFTLVREGRLRLEVDTETAAGQGELSIVCQRMPRRLL